MKKLKFSDGRIMAILKQAENGEPVADLCREHGINSANFYKWRSKYGGMDASLMARIKELEEENKRGRTVIADSLSRHRASSSACNLLSHHRIRSMEMRRDVIVLESTITCPKCGHVETETMPTDACQWFYDCKDCKAVLESLPGDHCIYCSYATIPCPPIQAGDDCCSS